MSQELVAGIDAGGTSFKVGVATKNGELLEKGRVPTTTPTETVAASVRLLFDMASRAGGSITRLGVGSFGPLDIDPTSSRHGTILETPKPGWSMVPIKALLSEALRVPVGIDTDVNAALRAEMAVAADPDLKRAAYITVGTGIGVGVSVGGSFAGRPSHPELGHIRVERHPIDKQYVGLCPFHGACLEGLAAGPALEDRFGSLEALGPDQVAWDVAGFYLAQLCLTLCLTFRLQRILIGGGVAEASGLLPATHKAFREINGGYLPEAAAPHELIQKAKLGDDAGLQGALHCADLSQ